MKQLVCEDIKKFKYVEVDKPERKDGEALLKVNYLGLCGSDIHAYSGNQPFFSYPRVLGHEIVATVEEGEKFKKGEIVTVIPYFSCGTCIACRNNKRNACSTLTVLGVHVDGAMQDYISIPEEYIVNCEGINMRSASMIEPLAISTHAVKRANVVKDEIALIVGAGPIGIGAAQVVLAEGGQVIMADINEKKLGIISKELNLLGVLNPLKEDYREKLESLTNKEFPTLIIDATGNSTSMGNQVKYLAQGGRIVFIGLTKNDLVINDLEFHKRETTIYRSRAASRADFEYVIENIKNSKLNPNMLITHEAKFEDFKDDFQDWIKDESFIKGVIEY